MLGKRIMFKNIFFRAILRIVGSILCKLAEDIEPIKGSKLYKAADNIFDVLKIYREDTCSEFQVEGD